MQTQKHIEAQGKYVNPNQLHSAVLLLTMYKHKLPFWGVVSRSREQSIIGVAFLEGVRWKEVAHSITGDNC